MQSVLILLKIVRIVYIIIIVYTNKSPTNEASVVTFKVAPVIIRISCPAINEPKPIRPEIYRALILYTSTKYISNIHMDI